MSNDLHRYENDLPRFLLTGVVIGFAALLLTVVAYAVGRHAGETSGAVTTAPATSTAPTGAQRKALFTQFGCGGCHTFAPAGTNGTIGPDLAASAASAQADGNLPIEKYVAESITDPDAYITPGYHAGVMPTTYAGQITPAQVQALVAFIVAGQKP